MTTQWAATSLTAPSRSQSFTLAERGLLVGWLMRIVHDGASHDPNTMHRSKK
ncbi:hypothetical protein ACIBJF_42050 [Streptomyces sp. NPDC050743]|uniref:hypothetical protein n=1 Tax=Streptomyces sp. NPDC050743 TaxID=3365634 RepID=UPI0037B24453